MKVRYYFWAITALLLSIFAVACENTDDGIDDSQPIETFVLNVIGSMRNNSAEHLQLQVDVSGYDGLYLIGMVSEDIYNSEMSGDADEYVRYLINYVQGAGSSLTQYDNNYVFKGDSSADIQLTWTPEYDTDYKFFVFGISETEDLTTEVVIMDYTTEAAPDAIYSLEVTGTSCNDLGVIVSVAEGESADYVVGVVKKDYYENSLSSNDYLLPDYVLGQSTLLGEGSYAVGNGYIFNGNSTVDLAGAWELLPETEYVVVCAALTTYDSGDEDLIICDTETLATAFATTDSTEKVEDNLNDSSFVIEPYSIGYIDVIFTVTNTNNVDLFYVELIPKALFDSDEIGADPTTAARYMIDYRFSATDFTDITIYTNVPWFDGSSSETSIFYYYSSKYWTSLTPENEYVAMAFEISSAGEILSEVTTMNFTTEAAPVMNEVTFEIEAVEDFSVSNFKVNVTPNQKDIIYAVGVFDSKAFDSTEGYYINTTTGEADYVSAAEIWISEILGWYDPSVVDENGDPVVINLSEVDNIGVFMGDSEIDLSVTYTGTIKADYDYTVLAFTVDEVGYITSNISVQNVHTPAPEAIELTFEIEESVAPYYDGFGYSGQLIITPSDLTAPYFYTFVYGELTTTDIYGVVSEMTDAEIFEYNRIGTMIIAGTFLGQQTYDYMWASLDSDVVHLVAFGYENGGMTSAMYKYKVEK